MNRSARQLGSKLRLTSIALGCATTKELCRRFSAVNPDTQFTLQNSYKWLHGKARPRMSGIYDDWAAVLGVGLTPQFLASASFDEFAAALAAHFFVPAEALAALRVDEAGPADSPAGVTAQDVWARDQILSGAYLALSPAWSKANEGRLIVGSLAVGLDPGDEHAVIYRERLFGRTTAMHGRLNTDGRTAQVALVCEPTAGLYFLALNVPAPPASLVGGMLCGIALHDPESRPTASRIVFLRSHALDWEGLFERSRYLDPEAPLIEAELAALGYADRGGSRAAAAAGLAAFLGHGSGRGAVIDAPAGPLARLALDLDRLLAA